MRVCTHPCIAHECTDGSCKLAAGELYATAVINSGGLQHAHHEPTWQRQGVCRAVFADAPLQVVVGRALAHVLSVEAAALAGDADDAGGRKDGVGPAHTLVSPVKVAALAGDADAVGGKQGALLALAHVLSVEVAALAGDADAGGGKQGALLALAHALLVEGAVLAGDAVALRVRACSPSPRGKESVSGDGSQQPQHMAACVHTPLHRSCMHRRQLQAGGR